jgi:hypothetical protein
VRSRVPKPQDANASYRWGKKSSKCRSSVKYRILVTFNNDRTVKNEKGKMNIVITN